MLATGNNVPCSSLWGILNWARFNFSRPAVQMKAVLSARIKDGIKAGGESDSNAISVLGFTKPSAERDVLSSKRTLTPLLSSSSSIRRGHRYEIRFKSASDWNWLWWGWSRKVRDLQINNSWQVLKPDVIRILSVVDMQRPSWLSCFVGDHRLHVMFARGALWHFAVIFCRQHLSVRGKMAVTWHWCFIHMQV